MVASNSSTSIQTSATDVVVIGGGPAGATTSTLIAQAGFKVRLFERAHFPRFHIGESLIPETYWVLKRLNMLEKMKKSHFVEKCSVQFVSQHGRISEPFYFTDHNPHECSQTWQVVRSEFDLMMLNNAREHGVDAQEGVRVREVLFGGDKAVAVNLIPRVEADGFHFLDHDLGGAAVLAREPDGGKAPGQTRVEGDEHDGRNRHPNQGIHQGEPTLTQVRRLR